MTTRTLDVPGATLTYDVRPNDASTEPILLLIGSPMGAAGFGTLSQHFSDRTVVTYDPRGVERSVQTDPTSPVTPDVHADDLHRLIQAIGGGPVDLFVSSGGAVNALALVSKHPEDVRTLVAHEPPLASVLPDREHALAAARVVHETYPRSGWAPGWRTSSPSPAIRDRSPRRSPASRRPTRRCSACRPRTTARARTRCSAIT
jgi:pimeloyl-ACP methyl ester carboxylesterase